MASAFLSISSCIGVRACVLDRPDTANVVYVGKNPANLQLHLLVSILNNLLRDLHSRLDGDVVHIVLCHRSSLVGRRGHWRCPWLDFRRLRRLQHRPTRVHRY